ASPGRGRHPARADDGGRGRLRRDVAAARHGLLPLRCARARRRDGRQSRARRRHRGRRGADWGDLGLGPYGELRRDERVLHRRAPRGPAAFCRRAAAGPGRAAAGALGAALRPAGALGIRRAGGARRGGAPLSQSLARRLAGLRLDRRGRHDAAAGRARTWRLLRRCRRARPGPLGRRRPGRRGRIAAGQEPQPGRRARHRGRVLRWRREPRQAARRRARHRRHVALGCLADQPLAARRHAPMNPRSGLECLAARLGRSGLPVAAALALTTACARQPAKAPAKQPAAPQAALDGRRWLLEDVERASRAGAEPSEVIALDAGAPGDRISSVVELPADACVLLMARASASIDDVDLYAYADDGTLIGSDEAPEKTATLLLCPPHPRRVFVSARVAAGHGLVARGSQRVSVERAPKAAAAVGAKGRSGADPDQGAALWSGLDDAISEHRRSIGGQWQLLRKLPILVDPRVPARVSAEVEAESCLDVLVVPSEQTAYLDVLAIDDQGRILGRADSGADDTRSLIVCSPVRAPVTLELRPHAGQGLTAVI